MHARDLLHKALLLLTRGHTARGTEVLTEAITAARQEPDPPTLITALCCLGDVHAQENRPEEARAALTECLSTEVPPDLDDLCAAPQARARTLLTTLPPA